MKDEPIGVAWGQGRPLRPLFGGERGAVAMLRSIPGFAALWDREVPVRYLVETEDHDGRRCVLVACPCGRVPVLWSGDLVGCGCGRWFLSMGSSVRVKRFHEAYLAQPEPSYGAA